MPLNETFFITGFPGFLATRLVKRLAADGARFILLTQPAFVGAALEATRQIARDTGAKPENFQIVPGDITRSDLGLLPHELEKARAEVSSIFDLRSGGAARCGHPRQRGRHAKYQRVREDDQASATIQLCFDLLCRRQANWADKGR